MPFNTANPVLMALYTRLRIIPKLYRKRYDRRLLTITRHHALTTYEDILYALA